MPPAAEQTAQLPNVDEFVASTSAKIMHGDGQACFISKLDEIHMPMPASFAGSPTSFRLDSYYGTLQHEPSEACAMEELIVELGAAFLCAELAISVERRPDHAQYAAHWLSVLKTDKRMIFSAASKTSEAFTFLRAFSHGSSG